MDQITHEVRLVRWKEVIKQCQSRPEGQSIVSYLSPVRARLNMAQLFSNNYP